MSEPVDREILLGFLEEVRSYLPSIREGLEQFQRDESATEQMEEVHRCVHTIKGAASMVGLQGLSQVARRLETIIENLIYEMIARDEKTLAIVFCVIARIEAYLDCIANETDEEATFVQEAMAELSVLEGGSGDLPEPVIAPDFLMSGFEPPQESIAVSPPEFETVRESETISAELLDVFRMEAEDHLRVLTSVLPEVKKDPRDTTRWQMIRRAAHTLKGAAAMVGFTDVTRLSHRMEDLLDLYYEGARQATSDEIDLLLLATDAIDDTVSGRSVTSFSQLLSRFEEILSVDPKTDEVPSQAPLEVEQEQVAANDEGIIQRNHGEAYVRVPTEKLNDIVNLVAELVISRSALEQRMGDFHRLLREMEPSVARLRKASNKLETGYEATALAGGRMSREPASYHSIESVDRYECDGFDDLEFDRYTEFHLISRELAETTNDIQTLSGELNELHADFEGQLTRQSRLSSEIEDRLMRLRMVPLSTIAPKLQRTVRNAAMQTAKKVELILEGEKTGLDKTVLEAMGDPLLHLLRNSVDHGLESPEVRRALGKPEQGTIRVKAAHDGNQVVLAIEDDGRGIDLESVRQTIVSRKLVTADVAASLVEEEVYSYLFAPGFSTKSEVTELSGRGVGLDVVKSKVETLKGSITIESRSGRGCSFTIRLPMTLAVMKALLVRCQQKVFALPLEAIEKIQRLDDEDISRIGQETFYRDQDHLYPIANLSKLLQLRSITSDKVDRPTIVLVKSGARRVALVVESLVGGREVVVKNLGNHLKRVRGVSGATLMGDGSVVLILNPHELIQNVHLTTQATTRRTSRRQSVGASPSTTQAGIKVMIVDDSPSVRRVLTQLAERSHWEVRSVKDGVEALESLQNGNWTPDILLSDVEMPRMDGFELLSTIRSAPNLSVLPVVMITSRAADKHRKKALELGASAYVTKPYQEESLVEIVRQLTRQVND